MQKFGARAELRITWYQWNNSGKIVGGGDSRCRLIAYSTKKKLQKKLHFFEGNFFFLGAMQNRCLVAGIPTEVRIVLFSHNVLGSPSGCGLCEIPGVTQVAKGHADNTGSQGSCWRKHEAWAADVLLLKENSSTR